MSSGPFVERENQTTKSLRHEEVKDQLPFSFVSLCLGGSVLVPRGETLLSFGVKRSRFFANDAEPSNLRSEFPRHLSKVRPFGQNFSQPP